VAGHELAARRMVEFIGANRLMDPFYVAPVILAVIAVLMRIG
jgi:hypothetical protein